MIVGILSAATLTACNQLPTSNSLAIRAPASDPTPTSSADPVFPIPPTPTILPTTSPVPKPTVTPTPKPTPTPAPKPSQNLRQELVGRLIFQDEATQAGDLLLAAPSPHATFAGTQPQLVSYLLSLLDAGHYIEITAVQTGHHNDGYKGHAGGYAVDCWPLASPNPGDYLAATDPRFARFLEDAAASKFRYQIGLVGDGADSAENFALAISAAQTGGNYEAGVTVFQDDGGPHVHLGANGF